MKKICILIFTVIFGCLALAGCSQSDEEINKDFIADEKHCVVSLPQEYDISYENYEETVLSAVDNDLYNAETVNGVRKKEGFIYYNILKNEPFKILTPLGVIRNKNENRETLLYWKLNETLYKDGDNYYSANTFTCEKDTEITPVYYEFRAVGMLLHKIGENDMPIVPDDEIFDENGNVKEQDGVYYLYGVYDFEPNREFWRTNLTINKYSINHTEQYVSENHSEEFYTINIEIDKGNLFNKGKIIVETLYKIDGHGYMTYGAGQVINNDEVEKAIRTLPIGKHEIKYTFA